MSDKPIDAEQGQALARRADELAPAIKQESFADLLALAQQLVTTGFLPAAVKTPAQAVAIILTGRELGLPAMQSLRSISIIQGKPELAADLQLSIFHRDGGRSKWKELTPVRAVLWLKHPNGDEHIEEFTMEDARRAGLANGSNWQKYPKAMLRSRAITAGLKSIGFEPLSGAYAPGEIGGPEIVGPEPETVTGEEPPKPAKAAPSPPPKVPLPPATSETLQRYVEALRTAGLDRVATEFYQKIRDPAALLPTESLEHLPLQFVPVTVKQLKKALAQIKRFADGAPDALQHPFAPNEVEEPEPAKGKAKKQADKGRDPEWFWTIICPVPHKGQKRDAYLKAPDTIRSMYEACKSGDEETCRRLWGFVGHFTGEWTDRQGKVHPPAEADKKFREALDAFNDYHEKHENDTEQTPELPIEPEPEPEEDFR